MGEKPMNEWWADFCERENKARIAEMQNRIAQLEKGLGNDKIPCHVEAGRYPLAFVDCAGKPIGAMV